MRPDQKLDDAGRPFRSYRRALFAGVAIAGGLAGAILWPGTTVPAEKTTSAATPANHPSFDPQSFWRTTKIYCDTCHLGPKARANLNLQALDFAHLDVNGEAWEKILRKLRNREMPPAGTPRPDAATYETLVASIENERDRLGQIRPNPGRPAVHRLNRTEYANAIRDLLAVDAAAINIGELLPTDDSGYGFDNNGDVLTVSPVLMEGYLSAARRISRTAIGDRKASPVFESYDIPRFLIQDDRMGEDLPLGSRGGIAVRHHFPLDAEYVLRIKLQKNGYTYTLGTEHARQIDIRLDGQKIKQFIVGGDYKGKRPAQPSSFGQGEYERYLINADQNLEMRFPAKAGTHLVQVTLPNHTAEPEGMFEPPITDYSFALSYGRPDMEPAVANLTIGGPYDAKGTGETESRARIFVCNPAAASDEDACARRILSNLAHRAFRRPVSDADVQDLLSFYKSGRGGGSFEDGIEAALQRILVDPEFLFRIEKEPPNVAAGTAYRISDLELASRLSFFLWSSIPDDQLLDLAEHNKLGAPGMLEQQVRRMLADPRADALVNNFAGQWLYLRNVEKVWPNPDVYPEFDANLRDAFAKESELFFQTMLKEDRSVLDLIDADYTFLNERLARHYGIPNVYGSHFRRVTLTDENRRGLLGQGSLLTVTSYATRTAPTIRGKWLLENILGTPPPPPPANVPSLALKTATDGSLLTMRQQMEAHRANPACASCHKLMDPLGFALENFDATGKWRSMDGNSKIDASGFTPDGFPLHGPADLRDYLMSRPDQFAATVTGKLLTYALGRGVEEYDYPVIRKIVRESAPGNYKWSSLVVAITESTPFQMRRSRKP
jgi:hypothetical protein